MHLAIRLSILALIATVIVGVAFFSASTRAQRVGRNAAAAAACVTAPPGMVSWWPGDGNANDIRGENPGTLNGSATATNAGKVAQTFTFDGAGEVTVPDAPSLSPQQLTIDAWVFPTVVDGSNDIIVNKEVSSPVQYEMSIRGTTVGPGGTIPVGNLAVYIGGISGLPDDEGGWVNGGGQVPLNTWTHVAMTFDGSSLKAFINGTETRNITGLSGSVVTTTGPFRIGARNPANGFGNESFNGSIDEVELFNRALSPAEIQGIFNAGSAGQCRPRCATPPAGMVSWWTGDDSPFDSFGTNHGTLVNGATFAPGKVGRGFSLDGQNDYVAIAPGAAIDVGTGSGMTVEAWIEPTGTDTNPIFEWSNAAYGAHFWNGLGCVSYPCAPAAIANALYANIVDTAGNNHFIGTSTGVVTPNVFQHVALTYDKASGDAVIYVNGTVVQTQNLGTFTPRTNLPLNLGGRPVPDPSCTGPGCVFGGVIDEASIYNRALSATEIQAINNTGFAGKCKQCLTPPSGMVGWWNGDANPNDSSGSGNNGTLQGGSGFAIGRAGQAFRFDGLSGSLVVPDSNSLDVTTQFTLNAWINPASLQGDLSQGGIISKIGGPNGDNGYQFGIHANNSQLYCQFNAAGEPWPTNQLLVTLPSIIPVNAWTHVACTFDNTNLKIYVNGASVGSLAVGPKSVVNSASNLRISGDDNNNVHFNGLIDEPQVFNRALSQTELQSIVAAGSNGQCKIGCTPAPANMVSWWDGSGSGTTANDIQGPNVGTLQSGATFTQGKVGQAFILDGTDDQVFVPASASLDVGNSSGLTMDMWINPVNAQNPGPLLEWNNGSSFGVHFFVSGSFPGIGGPGSLYANVLDNFGNSHIFASAQNLVVSGQYQHVALTYDKNSGLGKIYRNGVVVAQQNLGNFTPLTTYNLYLGARVADPSPGGSMYHFQGAMDEVELFNRALTDTEVAAIYNTGSVGKCKTGGQTPVVQAGDATLTFPSGTSAGNTTYQTLDTYQPGPMPFGFNSPVHVADISTTATFNSAVHACFNLQAVSDQATFNQLRILHLEGNDLINRTSFSQFATRTLCADVSSLSPLVIAQGPSLPTAAAGKISGRVTLPDGSPLGGAVISLNGQRTATTITDSAGHYQFDNLEAGNFYVVAPSIANYTFVPAQRSFSLIGNQTDTVFTAIPNALPAANPLDTTEFFVRQQYLDLLGREPDPGGLEYWSQQINQCQDDSICSRQKRLQVANAFFFEQEYQKTGAYVFRLYRAAFGNEQPLSNPDSGHQAEAQKLPAYAAFARDRARVIGGSGLRQSQLALANEFGQREEFRIRYPLSLTGAGFVDAVIANLKSDNGVDLSSQRRVLLDLYTAGGRGAVIYRLADDDSQDNPIDNRAFIDAEYNRAFVFSQYSAYLRRDADIPGFLFWLSQINSRPLRDFGKQRAMLCSFITAAEYQQRFSPVVTHSNAECPR